MSPKTSAKIKRACENIFLLWLPLLLFIVFIIIPLFWALSVSFKEGKEVINGTFSILPSHFTFENYAYVWNTNKISIYFKNSLIISAASVIFVVILAMFNGYALSHCQFKGKNAFILILLMTQMVPGILTLTPLFIMVKNMGLTDTRLALVILNIAGGIPYNTLLMKGFIGGVPRELDEAAIIDGCTRWQVITKIIVPVVRPGIVTVAAFSFISCWNEYLTSYTFLSTTTKFPISVGLKYMIGEFSVNYSALAAGSIIALIPPLILFGYVQKYLVSGMSAGAVKG